MGQCNYKKIIDKSFLIYAFKNHLQSEVELETKKMYNRYYQLILKE